MDEDNTMFALVGFERFFELFVKDILRLAHPYLIAFVDPRVKNKPIKTIDLITQIEQGIFSPRLFDGKIGSIPFKITLIRLYDLIAYTKEDKMIDEHEIVRKFKNKSLMHICF